MSPVRDALSIGLTLSGPDVVLSPCSMTSWSIVCTTPN